MRVILFGASGMVGQGVLRECILDSAVQTVLLVGRGATGVSNNKIREIVHPDIADLTPIEADLQGFDACFFCLGVSSLGMSEADYRRITHDLTVGAANTLARLNPGMTFIYVSGVGTDSSEKGGTMWARVKGATENALLRMPFKAAYMFRPGLIQPMNGETSSAALLRIAYKVLKPLVPLLMRIAPQYATTTVRMGRAMLALAKDPGQYSKRVLESADINSFS